MTKITDTHLYRAQLMLGLEDIVGGGTVVMDNPSGDMMTVKLSYQGREESAYVLALDSQTGTGMSPTESNVTSHKIMVPKRGETHEWAVRLDDEDTPIHRYSLHHRRGYQPQVIGQRIFATHKTRYEREDQLLKNLCYPKGVLYKEDNVHCLWNPGHPDDAPIVMLMVPVEKGKQLSPFYQMLVKKTGGAKKYLLRFDETGGRI
jgi:hypothetical protein